MQGERALEESLYITVLCSMQPKDQAGKASRYMLRRWKDHGNQNCAFATFCFYACNSLLLRELLPTISLLAISSMRFHLELFLAPTPNVAFLRTNMFQKAAKADDHCQRRPT